MGVAARDNPIIGNMDAMLLDLAIASVQHRQLNLWDRGDLEGMQAVLDKKPPPNVFATEMRKFLDAMGDKYIKANLEEAYYRYVDGAHDCPKCKGSGSYKVRLHPALDS